VLLLTAHAGLAAANQIVVVGNGGTVFFDGGIEISIEKKLTGGAIAEVVIAVIVVVLAGVTVACWWSREARIADYDNIDVVNVNEPDDRSAKKLL
jgi:hypothetical protein